MYTCFGTNYLGTGNDTLTVTVVGATPTNVTSFSNTPTSVTVSWQSPAGSLSDSLTHYNLRYWKESESSAIQERNVSEAMMITLEQLEEYTLYSFVVRSIYEEEITSEFTATSVLTLQDGQSSSYCICICAIL